VTDTHPSDYPLSDSSIHYWIIAIKNLLEPVDAFSIFPLVSGFQVFVTEAGRGGGTIHAGLRFKPN